jgi:hypothetical protein
VIATDSAESQAGLLSHANGGGEAPMKRLSLGLVSLSAISGRSDAELIELVVFIK